MIPVDSQNLESYVPVFDAVPEKWEDARAFIVEQLKKLGNGINIREIGWLLDQELLTGKAFIPGVNNALDGGSSQTFRSVLRIVVNCSPLVVGANAFPHGIVFDANFTLVDLWCAATNSTTLTATIFCNSDTINLDATNINITSNGSYDRAYTVIEYLQEI